MWRPSTELRLPSWLCVAIAVGAGGLGIWCGRAGLAALDNSTGYERFIGFGLLLFAGGAFLVTAVALTFARSRLLFWVGVAGLVVVFVSTTKPKQRQAMRGPIEVVAHASVSQASAIGSPLPRFQACSAA